MCSFWHVECLALEGKREMGREHIEKMLSYANHLGLFLLARTPAAAPKIIKNGM